MTGKGDTGVRISRSEYLAFFFSTPTHISNKKHGPMQGFYFLVPLCVRWGLSGKVLPSSLSTIHFQDKRLQTSLSGTKIEQTSYLFKEKIHITKNFILT